MEKQVLVPSAGAVYEQLGKPISNVIVHGDLVLFAGQAPVNEDFTVIDGDFTAHCHKVFENMRHNLAAAGCTYEDVLKVTSLLANPDDLDTYNEIYREYFKPPYPVRVTYVAQLLR